MTRNNQRSGFVRCSPKRLMMAGYNRFDSLIRRSPAWCRKSQTDYSRHSMGTLGPDLQRIDHTRRGHRTGSNTDRSETVHLFHSK